MRFTQFTTVEDPRRWGREKAGCSFRGSTSVPLTWMFPFLFSPLSMLLTYPHLSHDQFNSIPSPYSPNVLSLILLSPPVRIFASVSWLVLFPFSLCSCKSYPGSPLPESPTLQCYLCPESQGHLLTVR